MARLIRLDRTGHTELAQWSAGDSASHGRAVTVFEQELAGGYMGVAQLPDGSLEQVKELPPGADLVMLRRPIAGG